MGYRGEDLDLRTSPMGSATQADLVDWAPAGDAGPGAADEVQRSGPIWVDETLLACCNHAFDVALAHRASEVRLEHLIHALTRTDVAAEMLEARGVRVAALRRDNASVIASEVTVGLLSGMGAPRRSEELETVLRMAAGVAARRSAPAGVEDVLNVMLDLEPGLAGLGPLARHLGRTGADILPRGFPEIQEPPRERIRVPAGSAYYTEAWRSGRGEGAAQADEGTRGSRIDALEQMVRALGADLASERRVLSDVLQGIQRELMTQRDSTGRLGGMFHDRGFGAEAVFDPRLGDIGQTLAAIAGRLDGLERVIEHGLDSSERATRTLGEKLSALEASLKSAAGGVDLAPLVHRLEVIEEAVLSQDAEAGRDIGGQLVKLHGQIGALSEALERQRGEIAVAVITPFKEQVGNLIGEVESHNKDAAESMAGLAKRMDALEGQFAASADKMAEAQEAYAQELGEVHEALLKLNAAQHALSGAVEDWRTADSGVLDVLQAVSATTDRLHTVMVKRYHWRNRLWYWLFGTDDWIAASWPSQAARVEDELRAFKNPMK